MLRRASQNSILTTNAEAKMDEDELEEEAIKPIVYNMHGCSLGDYEDHATHQLTIHKRPGTPCSFAVFHFGELKQEWHQPMEFPTNLDLLPRKLEDCIVPLAFRILLCDESGCQLLRVMWLPFVRGTSPTDTVR